MTRGSSSEFEVLPRQLFAAALSLRTLTGKE